MPLAASSGPSAVASVSGAAQEGVKGSGGVDILGACCPEACLGGTVRQLGWVKRARSCRNMHIVVCVWMIVHINFVHVHAQYMHDM